METAAAVGPVQGPEAAGLFLRVAGARRREWQEMVEPARDVIPERQRVRVQRGESG